MSFRGLLIVFVVAATIVPGAIGQPPGGRGRGGRFRSFDIGRMLLSMEEVKKELKITREQENLLEALAEDLRAQRRGRRQSSSNGGTNERQRLETSTKLTSVLLETNQTERLSQLKYQFQGPYAIDDEQFANDIQLTEKQIEAIKDARQRRAFEIESLQDTIGEEPLARWRKKLGETYKFGKELVDFRRVYQFQRRAAETR